MYVFINAAQIPGRPNQFAIPLVAFDPQQFQASRNQLTPGYKVFRVDETELGNQTRCVDIYNSLGRTSMSSDGYPLEKYYADPANNIWQRGGWQFYPPGTTFTEDPSRAIQITFARSPERAAFDDNLPSHRNFLNNIINNPPNNVAQLALAVSRMATMLLAHINVTNKIMGPDQ